MKASEFVDVIGEVVRDAAVEDVILLVQDPPHRVPPQNLVELGEWYNALDGQAQGMAKRMLGMVARAAVFGFLCVLDGSRAVERQRGPKGYFELRYIKNGEVSVLCGPAGQVLHELLE